MNLLQRPKSRKRKAEIIAIALVIMTTIGCGCTQQAALRDLYRAEALIDALPDSALALLQSIDGSTLGGEPRARHALLLSWAYDKNCIDVTDDSLINIACDYYSLQSDALNYYCRAVYYKGVVNYNAENYNSSICNMVIADSLAALASDINLQGKANAFIALALSQFNYLEAELDYSLKALGYFIFSDDSIHAAAQRVNVATCYSQLGQYEKALEILKRRDCAANNFATATSLLGLGEIAEFEDLLELDSSLRQQSKIMARYAKALVDANRLDDAQKAVKAALNTAVDRFDSASCLVAQSKIYRKQRLWHEYALCADSASAVNNRNILAMQHNSQPIGIINAYAFIHQRELAENQKTQERYVFYMILGTLLGVLLIVVVVLSYRKSVKNMSEYADAITRMKAEFEESETRRLRTEQRYVEAESQRLSAELKYREAEMKMLEVERASISSESSVPVIRAKTALIDLCNLFVALRENDLRGRLKIRAQIHKILAEDLQHFF